MAKVSEHMLSLSDVAEITAMYTMYTILLSPAPGGILAHFSVCNDFNFRMLTDLLTLTACFSSFHNVLIGLSKDFYLEILKH